MPKTNRKVINHPRFPSTNNDGVSALSSQRTIFTRRRETKAHNKKSTNSFSDAQKYDETKSISKSKQWMSWLVIIILSTSLIAVLLRSMNSVEVLPSAWISSFAHASTSAYEGSNSSDTCSEDLNTNDSFCDAKSPKVSTEIRVSEDCALVMAPSGISNAGWGVFTFTRRKRGEMMTDQGDIVIHLPDPNPNKAHEMRKLIWDYVWDGQETGGHYEGLRSISLVPGTGMLVNGDSKRHNLLPQFPTVDNGGLKRGIYPGAGAITHHHNFTWMLEHDLEAGDEFFVDYGPGWFHERGFADTSTPKKWDVDFLRQHGYCLDNIVPGASLLEGAGRGAFASRYIHAGTIIAPVPVIALSKGSLETMKERTDGTVVKSEQLLKNYCYGHPDSDLLLYPYSHGINLVNHHSTKPNAKLRWWNDSSPYFNRTLMELQQSSRLMFELVATNPINKGDEIYMDYGDEWDKAWQKHMESWRPDASNFHLSAETMNNNDDFHVLRTENEQQLQPYPQDVFTSCYYRYSDTNLLKSNHQRSMAVWKPRNGMISLRNLRPCRIIQRDPMTNFSSNNQGSSHIYTVIVMNRPGLKEHERIPKGHVHVVSHVPRNAIVFSDKVYTSDQHLPDAFRKEIGLGDLFPSQWKNLRN